MRISCRASLSHRVDSFVFRDVTVFLRLLCIVRPDVPRDDLRHVLAFRALAAVWTSRTVRRIALVFPVAVPVRCGVVQDLVVRAEVAAEVLVVHVFPLAEEAFFRHRALVGDDGDFPALDDFAHDAGRLVTGVDGNGFRGIQCR